MITDNMIYIVFAVCILYIENSKNALSSLVNVTDAAAGESETDLAFQYPPPPPCLY